MIKNRDEYNPTPIYNRKLLRNMIRERAIAMNGYHHLSGLVHRGFQDIKNTVKESK